MKNIEKVKQELSSNEYLRAAINMSNFLLVTDKDKSVPPLRNCGLIKIKMELQ